VRICKHLQSCVIVWVVAGWLYNIVHCCLTLSVIVPCASASLVLSHSSITSLCHSKLRTFLSLIVFTTSAAAAVTTTSLITAVFPGDLR